MGWKRGRVVRKIKEQKKYARRNTEEERKGRRKRKRGAIRSRKREILKTRESETEKNQNTGRGEEWENQRERRGARHTGGAGPQGRRRP